MYRDRREAGTELGRAVERLALERPLVLGIPRGGVPVAAEVARAIGAELGVVVARKIGAPWNPELAIGATTANGALWLDDEAVAFVGATEDWIEAERRRQVEEARRRETLFDSTHRPSIAGRDVVVVDDGIATGSTAMAAVRAVEADGAARVVLAVPVAPPSAVARLREVADDVLCLHEDPDFLAVGSYYADFGQVRDAEVKAILDAHRAGRRGASSRDRAA
jgi:predicted phosphoribosyltransferase